MPKSVSRIITGIGSSPLQIGELFGVDEIDFGFERRVEAVHPGAQFGEDWCVAAIDRVKAWSKHVRDLALINENCRLRFAHGQSRAVLDLLAVNRKTIK